MQSGEKVLILDRFTGVFGYESTTHPHASLVTVDGYDGWMRIPTDWIVPAPKKAEEAEIGDIWGTEDAKVRFIKVANDAWVEFENPRVHGRVPAYGDDVIGRHYQPISKEG